MNNSKEEYSKDLYELYRKCYHAVNQWTEYHLDVTRQQAIKNVLNQAFGDEPIENLSPIRQTLRTNLELFFAKGMTVQAVENLLIRGKI